MTLPVPPALRHEPPSYSDVVRSGSNSNSFTAPQPDQNGCYVGMRVRSQWQTINGEYYNGTISKQNLNGTYDIDYEDGDQDANVGIARIVKNNWVSFESENEIPSDSSEESQSESQLTNYSDEDDLGQDELIALMALSAVDKTKQQEKMHAQWLAGRLRAVDIANHAKKQKKEQQEQQLLSTTTTTVTPPPLPPPLPIPPQMAPLQSSIAVPSSPSPTKQTPTRLRAASHDPILNEMKVPSGRPYIKDSTARALSFKEHKEQFREYALKRYHELQRYRRMEQIEE